MIPHFLFTSTTFPEFESFCVDGVARPFGRSDFEGTVFDEVAVFEDVVACVVEGSDGMTGDLLRSLLDVRMTFLEVEEPFVGDVRFFVELDEGVMVRLRQIFLSGEFVTFWIFVVFATDDDVGGIEILEFLEEEVEESLVVQVGLRISQEDVLELNTDSVVDARHGCKSEEVPEVGGGKIITHPHWRDGGTTIYIKAAWRSEFKKINTDRCLHNQKIEIATDRRLHNQKIIRVVS